MNVMPACSVTRLHTHPPTPDTVACPSPPPHKTPAGQGSLGHGWSQQGQTVNVMPACSVTRLHTHPPTPDTVACPSPPPPKHPQGKVRWAMAGRNKAKLLEVQQQLAKYDPNIMEVCRSVMFWGFVRTFGGLPRTQAQQAQLGSGSRHKHVSLWGLGGRE